MHPVQQKLLKLADTYSIGNLTYREVGKLINEENPHHPQIIKHHLEQLERKGLINWDRENNLITRVTSGVSSNADFITIPVVGSANCGDATLFADEYVSDHIKVSTMLLGHHRRAFAIRAVGASMNQANISGKTLEDGDYAIVDPEDCDIRNNDYVLSVIDDTANIKKITFDHVHGQIILSSESSNSYPPIYIHESEAGRYIVNGKIFQVIKTPK